MFNSLSDLIITMCPHSIAKLLIELQKRARTYGKYVNIYIYIHIYILNIRIGILDYLREGFPWPAQPFKHMESNSFKHTATTFKYTNWYFILPPGPFCVARPPHI